MQVKVTVGETELSRVRQKITYSSLGRAEDCRVEAEILRFLVRVRFGGANFIYLLWFFKYVVFSWTPKIICSANKIFSLRCYHQRLQLTINICLYLSLSTKMTCLMLN